MRKFRFFLFLLLVSVLAAAQAPLRSVRIQAHALYKTDHRIFYRGVENPLTVEVSDIVADSLVLETSRGLLTGSRNSWMLTFPGDSSEAEDVVWIYLSKMDTAGKLMRKDSVSFSLRSVSPPEVLLAGRSGGLISKETLLSSDSLVAIFRNCHLAKRGVVLSFVMEYYKGFLFYKFEQENGARFTARQHSAVKFMSEGSIFGLHKIRVLCPDGVIRNAPSLSVEVGF